jgi:hypothetical protein
MLGYFRHNIIEDRVSAQLRPELEQGDPIGAEIFRIPKEVQVMLRIGSHTVTTVLCPEIAIGKFFKPPADSFHLAAVPETLKMSHIRHYMSAFRVIFEVSMCHPLRLTHRTDDVPRDRIISGFENGPLVFNTHLGGVSLKMLTH